MEKELNREQIIKALERCKTPSANDCDGCEYDGKCLKNGEYIGCVNLLVADALSLINKLTEENERLKASRYMAHPDGKVEMIPSIESVRADTANKMRDALLKKSTIIDGEDILYGLTYEQICQIAREMLEGG